MKNKGVCEGCRYHVKRHTESSLMNGTCEYLEVNEKSRLNVELQNGGYKKDSCVCYEKGIRKTRRCRLRL